MYSIIQFCYIPTPTYMCMCVYMFMFCLYTYMHKRKRLARNIPRVFKWGIMGVFWVITKIIHIYEKVDNREKYHMDWLTRSSYHPPTVPSTAATEKVPTLFPTFPCSQGCSNLESGSETQATLWSPYVDMRFPCSGIQCPVSRMVSGFCTQPQLTQVQRK